MGEQRGPLTSETKLLAAAALAKGLGTVAASEEAGISRASMYRLMAHDEEFAKIRRELADAIVAQAVQDLRALTDAAIAAFREGLTAEIILDSEGEETGEIRRPDLALRVRTADIVTKRIAEFAPQLSVSVSGSLEERLRELDSGEPAPED